MNDNVIKEIVNFINSNGDRFRLFFTVRGSGYPVAQKLVSEIISDKGSVFAYLQQYVNDLQPSNVVVNVKKPNGTGSGRNAVDKRFNFLPFDSQQSTTPQEFYHKAEPVLGSPKTGSLKDQYDFHLGMITKESNKYERQLIELQAKYKKEKKARQKLQLAYDIQEEKNRYKLKLAELEGKNTFAGLAQEIMPHVKSLAGDYIASKNNSAALEGTPAIDQRIADITEALKMIKDEQQIQFYYETMARMATFQAEQIPLFINHLRELTPTTKL